MKNLFYIFLLFTSICYSQQTDKKYWIGKEIKSGGFLLDKGNFDTDYGIAFSNDEIKIFLLFFKIENTRKIIIDILEINKKELQGNKLTEYCYTNTVADAEIIAIVKNTDNNAEFYTKIRKAWRANRIKGRFEKITKKKLKKCGNESYGI